MLLLGAIKPIIEKKFKTCFIFTRLFMRVESIQNKTSFVSLRCMFACGIKHISQKKEKRTYLIFIISRFYLVGTHLNHKK